MKTLALETLSLSEKRGKTSITSRTDRHRLNIIQSSILDIYIKCKKKKALSGVGQGVEKERT